MSPVKVAELSSHAGDDEGREDDPEHGSYRAAMESTHGLTENQRNLSLSVMLSKPILALEFSCLKMQVEAPVVISHGKEPSPGYS